MLSLGSLSSTEALYGKKLFLNNVGSGRVRGERGLRPRSLQGQSSTKEASAEERGLG